jgi:hypothetical protein
METGGKKMKTKCECGYEWECESKHQYVSCPSCMRKTKVNKLKTNVKQSATKFYGGKTK